MNKYIIPDNFIIDRESEINLFKRLPNEPELREYIVQRCQRFVRYFAVKYRCNTIDVLDLVQEGNIGLLKAIDSYDVDQNVPFTSYAAYHIKAKIRDYIIRYSKPVPIATTKKQRLLYYNIGKYLDNSQHISGNNRKRIKEDLQVSDADIDKVCGLLNGVISLDYNFDDSLISNNIAPLDIQIENENIDNVYNKVISLLDNVSERDKYIFVKRNINETVTLDSLSKELNISKERVRQLENKTFNFLKNNTELQHLYYNTCV